MEPSEVVHLVQRVVVGCGWIERSLELRAVYLQRLSVALGEEVAAVVAVGIARADGCGVAAPAHRATAIEQPLACHFARGHLLKVVGGGKLRGKQLLVLQMAAIAIELHLSRIAEPGAADKFVGDIVDTVLRHPYLYPSSRGKHRMVGVCGSCGFGLAGIGAAHRTLHCFRLHCYHEAHELLVAAIAHHHRHESHHERRLLAVEHHTLLHFGHLAGLGVAELKIAFHLGFGHVYKLRIAQADGVGAVGIVVGKGYRTGEMGQQGVYPHLFGSEVEEPLCRQTRGMCHKKQHGQHEPIHI